MAKVDIRGHRIGTIGDMVFYVRNGKQCMRRKPKKQKNPNTQGQRESRGHFATMSKLSSLLLPITKVGLHKFAMRRKGSVYNVFMKLNGKAVTAEGVDYGSVTVSHGGEVANVKFGVPTLTTKGRLDVVFEPRVAKAGEPGYEEVLVGAVCPEKNGCRLSEAFSCESGVVRLQVPASWAKHRIHLYGFVRRKGLRTSNSVYIPLAQDLEE